MSFNHTPEGFKKDFIRTLQQRGGAEVFDTRHRTNRYTTDDEQYLSQYLDERPSVHVAHIQTKTGKLFVYPVPSDRVMSAVDSNNQADLETLKNVVDSAVAMIKREIRRGGSDDDDVIQNIIELSSGGPVRLVHTLLSQEGLVAQAAQIFASSSMNLDTFKQKIDDSDNDIALGVVKYLVEWITPHITAKDIDAIRGSIDPYVATVMLENLNIVPTIFNLKYPSENATEYWNREVNVLIEDFRDELSDDTTKQQAILNAVVLLADVANAYNGVVSFADFEEQRRSDVLKNGHTPDSQRTRSLTNHYPMKLYQTLNEVGRVQTQVNSLLGWDTVMFNRFIKSLLGQSGGQMSPLLPSNQVNLIGGKVLLFDNAIKGIKDLLQRQEGEQFSVNTDNKIKNLLKNFGAKENNIVQKINELKLSGSDFNRVHDITAEIKSYLTDMSRFTDLIIQLQKSRGF